MWRMVVDLPAPDASNSRLPKRSALYLSISADQLDRLGRVPDIAGGSGNHIERLLKR
jgi:hypothetical protein